MLRWGKKKKRRKKKKKSPINRWLPPTTVGPRLIPGVQKNTLQSVVPYTNCEVRYTYILMGGTVAKITETKIPTDLNTGLRKYIHSLYLHLAVIERGTRGWTLNLTRHHGLPHERHALRWEPLDLLRCHRHAHARLRRLHEHLGTGRGGEERWGRTRLRFMHASKYARTLGEANCQQSL